MCSGLLAKKAFAPQLSTRELALIARIVRHRRPAHLLVFGLGRDSVIWHGINSTGKTLFLEDNAGWIMQCLSVNPALDVRTVSYDTHRTEWKTLIGSEKLDSFALDSDISSQGWDVIFADAPQGWNDDTPGRMQSIHWAEKLLAEDGELLIHDCHREVERACADHYGRHMRFNGQVDKLRHYTAISGRAKHDT